MRHSLHPYVVADWNSIYACHLQHCWSFESGGIVYERRIAVVILNWNGREYLARFLSSVVRHSAGMADVVVVDNASTDGSVDFLRTEHPEVRVIQNRENGGFAKGYNDGLAQVDAEFYVLLNSDVEVTANWLEPLIETFDADTAVAACQPKIRSWQERDRFEYAGAAGGFIDAFGYPFCRGRIFDTLESDDGQYDDTCEIFWATGACLMVRSSLYHSLGGLDADFFAHMEEIDFCWRLKSAGHRIVYCPGSTVYHVGGGSLPKSSPRKTYLNFRNNLFLLVKNLPSKSLGWVLLVRGFLDMLAALQFLLKGAPADAVAVFKAQFHVMCALPRFIEKRRTLIHAKIGQMYKGSIVFAHYLRGVRCFSQLNPNQWT
jgi:GT2 family glycosyltransferase